MKVVDFEEVIYLLGKYYTCDNQIVDLIEQESFEIPEWTKAADKLPEPFADVVWNINDRYIVGWLDNRNILNVYTPSGWKEFSDRITSVEKCEWMYLPKGDGNEN